MLNEIIGAICTRKDKNSLKGGNALNKTRTLRMNGTSIKCIGVLHKRDLVRRDLVNGTVCVLF